MNLRRKDSPYRMLVKHRYLQSAMLPKNTSSIWPMTI